MREASNGTGSFRLQLAADDGILLHGLHGHLELPPCALPL